MENITAFFTRAFAEFAEADFAFLLLIDVCSFFLVFLVALFACAFSARARESDKKPFLRAVDLFTAITLAIFLCEFGLQQSVLASAVFWAVGFVLYGALCLFRPKEKYSPAAENCGYVRPLSETHRPMNRPAAVAAPAAQSAVRLDHALSIADKLLVKNLGRGDRQELERIKTALTVFKVKGSLSPQEGERLNEMFNTLLKLMAKYDL